MADADKQPTINEAIAEVAKDVAKALPDSLLVRVLEGSILDGLTRLTKGYSTDNIEKIIAKAIDERVDELLKTKYAGRVNEIAETLANEAIYIAKQDVSARKKSSRY